MTTATKKPRHRNRIKSGPNQPSRAEVRLWMPQHVEVRADSKDSNVINLRGLVIRWGTSYEVRDAVGTFQETIHRGATTRTLADPSSETKFYYGHGGLPLASRSTGTLKLTDTDEGLSVFASLDARQQLANDLAISIERGDVAQMSVGMVVNEDKWSDDYTQRSISDIDVLDASAVDFGASPTTCIEVARSRYGSTFTPSTEQRGGRGVVTEAMTYRELLADMDKLAKKHAKQAERIEAIFGKDEDGVPHNMAVILQQARKLVAEYEEEQIWAELERIAKAALHEGNKASV